MASPIRVLRRKRRQAPLTGTAADVITWFVDDLGTGGGQTAITLIFLATGMAQTSPDLTGAFRVFFDAGGGYGERTILSAVGTPTSDGFQVVLAVDLEITGNSYQVMLNANQTSIAGPQGQRVFCGQAFPAGAYGSQCTQVG